MSYTGSKSQIGSQFTLTIGTSTPPNIGEITDYGQNGTQMGTVDSTNLSSLSEEFIKSLLKPGSVDVTYNRVSTDTGQIAVRTDFYAGTIQPFKATLPLAPGQTTTGDTIAWTALIEEYDELSSVKADKIIPTKVKLKVQGGATATPFTFTAGS